MSIRDISQYIKFSEGRNYSSSFQFFSWNLAYDKLLICAANGNGSFKNCIFHLCIPSVLSSAWNLRLLNEWMNTYIHIVRNTKSKKNKLVNSCIFIKVSVRKNLNAYVFIRNVTQPHKKRSHHFILLKSTLCNVPQGQEQPEEKGPPGTLIKWVLGK